MSDKYRTLVTAVLRVSAVYYLVLAFEALVVPLTKTLLALLTTIDLEAPLWTQVVPLTMFYLLLAFLIYLAAPFLSGVCLRESQADGTKSDGETEMDGALVFCTGILLMAWGFTRATNAVFYLLTPGMGAALCRNLVFLFLNLALCLCGALVAIRASRSRTRMAGKPNTEGQEPT